jgi:hypothetical protein
MIFSACGGFLLVNQDFRAVRFFFNPVGLILFGACVAADGYRPESWWGSLRSAHPASTWEALADLARVPLLMLPWFPLLPLYLWRRRGEGVLVQPLWRLVLCWTISGLMVQCLCLADRSGAAALPGLSLLFAVALVDCLAWLASPRSRSAQLAALMAACWLLIAGTLLYTQ